GHAIAGILERGELPLEGRSLRPPDVPPFAAVERIQQGALFRLVVDGPARPGLLLLVPDGRAAVYGQRFGACCGHGRSPFRRCREEAARAAKPFLSPFFRFPRASSVAAIQLARSAAWAGVALRSGVRRGVRPA